MSEARKITAQYLNGLAVGTMATFGGAYIAGETSELPLVAAALASLIMHLFARWLMLPEP